MLLSSTVRSILHLRIPIVDVSWKMTSSSLPRSASWQITVSSHAGRSFFMYTGVKLTSLAPAANSRSIV